MHKQLGHVFTLKESASKELAGIPAIAIAVWPRFRSGDYLVTLRFFQAVKYGSELVTQIDVFASELEHVSREPDMAGTHRSKLRAGRHR